MGEPVGAAVRVTERARRQPEAGDLAQEVYLRMLRVPDMEAVRNPEAYLYTVANNLAREYAGRGGRSVAKVPDRHRASCLML